MLENYLKIALRNLRKYPGYTFINVFGLAVGLVCSILILLWIRDELSYDRHIANADRIYRVVMNARMQERDLQAVVTPPPMAHTMVRDYPEVEAATRVFTLTGQVLIKRDDRQFLEERFFIADSIFFEVFAFPVIAGDPATALDEPYTIVLTEAMAKKYFPEGNALGQTLTVTDTTDYRVTGIVGNVPSNTHFHFDFLASASSSGGGGAFEGGWFSNNLSTYILLQEGFPPDRLDAKIPEMIRKYGEGSLQDFLGQTFDQFEQAGNRYDFDLQPITDIHLRSHLEFETEPNGNITYVYLFGAVAFFILLIACINFMNLATARSAGRAREVGMRKVLGSNREQLITQFLAESVLLGVVALGIAIAAVLLLLPAFNNLATKSIGADDLLNAWTIPVLLFLIIGVGLLAGSYPAFFLSSFQPVSVLKGNFDSSKRGVWLRSSLVVFQFAISMMLIAGTVVVYDQLNYVRDKSLGFDKEQVVVIRRAEQLGEQHSAFKDEIRQYRNVVNAGASTSIPGGIFGQTAYRPEGANSDVQYLMSPMNADHDWVETMGIEMAAGRDFSEEFGTDTSAFVLNAAAIRSMALADPIGHRLTLIGARETMPIIGVMRDFHTASLHQEIGPLAIRLGRFPMPYISVRILPEDVPGTLAYLEKTWNRFVPGQPFEYSFLDQDFDGLYRADRQLGQIFTIFAILAILIACLGLFGLASFTTQQRTKEIGVRKVLGAAIGSLVLLLSREFTRLVLVAFIIAVPIAYFIMNRWLEDFAYRVEIGVGTFILTGVLAIIIALITVSYQVIRASLANPVKSLRYE